ncbi:MAG: glycerol kinase GlpK [Phycisphaeraceae bacterium]
MTETTDCIAAIDQGTTSTRCMLFGQQGGVLASAQAEHAQFYPQPGWVEHDPHEIWQRTCEVVRAALNKAGGAHVAAVGLTNQRETVVFWNRRTGEPYGNAIVWQDTRTRELCEDLGRVFGAGRFREQTGLPLATYFSGPKIRWALDHLPRLKQAAERGEAVCGTVDSWLIWNLTGGVDGGAHVTDATNASRTLLMNLHTLQWDEAILDAMDVPASMLPRIVPSSDPAGWGVTRADGPFGEGVPVCGAVGDQQAAMLGQCCFERGEVKNTCGTGCFMLLNMGETPVFSEHGLLTTLAYQLGDAPPAYALEGSIAIAGALVQWLRDNLGFFETAPDIEPLARSVEDSAGVYIVPAFSGLFAPYWRSDARGVICGLTRYVTKAHLARAALEATAYQTRDVLDAMRQDTGLAPENLRVDGGMVGNELLMQFQADLLGIEVVRPRVAETTALGAAYAAGLAVGFWRDLGELRRQWAIDRTWRPAIDAAQRERMYAGWRKAVTRSLDWAE